MPFQTNTLPKDRKKDLVIVWPGETAVFVLRENCCCRALPWILNCPSGLIILVCFKKIFDVQMQPEPVHNDLGDQGCSLTTTLKFNQKINKNIFVTGKQRKYCHAPPATLQRDYLHTLTDRRRWKPFLPNTTWEIVNEVIMRYISASLWWILVNRQLCFDSYMTYWR